MRIVFCFDFVGRGLEFKKGFFNTGGVIVLIDSFTVFSGCR